MSTRVSLSIVAVSFLVACGDSDHGDRPMGSREPVGATGGATSPGGGPAAGGTPRTTTANSVPNTGGFSPANANVGGGPAVFAGTGGSATGTGLPVWDSASSLDGGRALPGAALTDGAGASTGDGRSEAVGAQPDGASRTGLGAGACCADGNCLCRGPDATALTSADGPFKTANFTISTGTVYYPTDAEPPFAAISLCGGFTNTGPEMVDWGSFYASYGIVTVIVTTEGLDLPDVRGQKLVAAIEDLKKENTKSGGKLEGKLAGRYGTSGYSMGGGGTTLASASAPALLTSVGLAAWGPDGSGVTVPTLFLCSDADTVAGCSGSQTAYDKMPKATPRMILKTSGSSHLDWYGPRDAGGGLSGAYALAFQKVYLEGDQRWKKLLLQPPTSGGSQITNIQ